MSDYFDRFWSLRIRDREGAFDFTISPNALTGSALRISFEINATVNFNFYTGMIKIYNLAENRRRFLVFNQLLREFGTGPSIQLTAGYAAKRGLIFDGAIHRGYTVRETGSGDWVTILHCGLPLKNDRRVNIPSQVVNDSNLFTYLSSAVDTIINDPDRIPIKKAPNYTQNFRSAIDTYLQSGNVKNKSLNYNGTAINILSEISREFNVDFFYDHNGFNAIRGDQEGSRNPRTIPLNAEFPEKTITRRNGLIGSPIYTDTGAKLRTYLQSDFRVFQLIRVQSDILDKKISILELKHMGDTYTNEWFSEIDGSQITELQR